MKNLFTLNHYFVKYKWHLLLGIFFVTGANYFSILIPQKIREALDLVQDKIHLFKDTQAAGQGALMDQLGHALLMFGLIVTGFAIVKGIMMYYMRQTLIVMSRLIEYDMRKEIFGHLQTLDQNYLRSHQTGDIMARISEDVSKVRDYLGPGLLYGINLVTLFAMTIYAMLKVDVKLTMYALLPLPFLSVSIYYVSNIINKKSAAIKAQLSTLNSTAQEAYSGIRVIKSYVKEAQFTEFFKDQSEEYKRRSLELAKIEAYFQPLMVLLISLSTLLVVLIGGFQVYDGKLTAGNIAEFILYVNMLTWPVTAIGWIASVIQEAEASQARINQIMDQKSGIQNTNSQVYPIHGDIEFKNVTFIYPNSGVVALQNVNFTLKKGQRMAIMGKTASGKTTIAELLSRMFDVTEGQILIDGKDIRQHNLSIIRDRISCVPQDVFLYSDTVAANIAFGKPDATMDEIQMYAEYASVKDDIEKLPEQFETMVGERGVTLSGGQKQRISIARAFIKKPDIVILDDALSAVDTSTEQSILSFFDHSLRDKTTIVITHRANNLLNYDKILVLDNGKIAEQGTHEELIRNEGFYQSVYQQQMM
ncbi:MAG TPA: ABC transporter ATP-binding protein [Saprospiraceae bacterium]|nr:ABC transporter ATP-binding protein [Saprospiraceae bacterium]HMT69034.1 ABC transporter ATP-binding protein [Saprospiraceae bacterium]